MGLDTFAVLSGKDSEGKRSNAPDGNFVGIRLCGGMCSGGSSSSSMRGKVYAGIVEEATGESLYEEYIEPETVAEMADKLAEFVKATSSKDINANFNLTKDEAKNLVKWFNVCKEHGYGICGWW